MNQPNPATLTLFDLLARRWQAAAAIADIRFAANGRSAAFATADGTVLIAGPDAEPPETRIRVSADVGQTTIRPRAKETAPLIAISSLCEGAPPLAAGDAGFLVGDGDGRVLHLAPDGASEPVFTLGGAIVALDHAAGITLAADRATLARRDGDTHRRDLPGLRALALSRDGRRTAAADRERLHLIGAGEVETRDLPGATRLAWRGDGAWLAAALGADGVALLAPGAGAAPPTRLTGFPAEVRDIGWSAAAAAFVAAGAFRIAAWTTADATATNEPLVTGQPGLVVVEAVAAHPTRPLVAAGFANGQVVIAAIGGRDELLLRQAGAAVTRLAFSPDGNQLAIGDADGALAIASFPSQMFK